MMQVPSFRRASALGALLALAGLATAHSAYPAADDTSVRYRVTVRQIEGHGSMPAHMSCGENKVCRGVMSISAAGGHMRVFVIALIDRGNARFRFHAEERDVSCGQSHDFVNFSLGPPPVALHGEAYLCDAPPSRGDAAEGPRAEPPVLKNITPPLATLRIDVRSRDPDSR